MSPKEFHFMESKEPALKDHEYLIDITTQSGDVISPKAIHDIIKRSGDMPTIIGGHAFNVLAKTKRQTQDVDLLAKSPAQAAAAVLKVNPQWHLDDRSHSLHQRLLNTKDEEVVDVIGYSAKPVWDAVKKGSSLKGGYRIPHLENYLAMKWASLTDPERSYDGKVRDEADIKTLLFQNMGKWEPASHITKKPRKKLMDELSKASPTADDMLKFEDFFSEVVGAFLRNNT